MGGHFRQHSPEPGPVTQAMIVQLTVSVKGSSPYPQRIAAFNVFNKVPTSFGGVQRSKGIIGMLLH